MNVWFSKQLQDEPRMDWEFLDSREFISTLQASIFYTGLLNGLERNVGPSVFGQRLEMHQQNLVSQVVGPPSLSGSPGTLFVLGHTPRGWLLSRRFPNLTQLVIFSCCFVCSSEFCHRIHILGKLNGIIFHLHDIFLYFVSGLLKDRIAKERALFT